jgi:hypothetical protein
MPEKKITAGQYSQSQWSEIKTLYQSGTFSSLKELHGYCKNYFKKCPSLQAIVKHSTEEKWSKTLMRDDLDEIKKRSYRELFEEEGMGDRETVLRIVKGIKHPDLLFQKISKKLEDNKLDPILLAAMADDLKEYFTDLKTSIIFIKERNKLCGAYELRIKFPGETDEDKSEEELVTAITQECKKLGINIK